MAYSKTPKCKIYLNLPAPELLAAAVASQAT